MDRSEVVIQQETAQVPDTGISLQQWLFERVADFIIGRVLEIADGEGIIAPVCALNGIHTEVKNIDLADEDFEERYAELMGQYDSLIVLNTGEQIRNNRDIVYNSTLLLKQGGYFITRLPARTALFNGLDQGFRRWKYYNLDYINKLLKEECRILKTRYFLVDLDSITSTATMGRYSERVTVFNEVNASGKITGLSMIIVGQTR